MFGVALDLFGGTSQITAWVVSFATCAVAGWSAPGRLRCCRGTRSFGKARNRPHACAPVQIKFFGRYKAGFIRDGVLLASRSKGHRRRRQRRLGQ